MVYDKLQLVHNQCNKWLTTLNFQCGRSSSQDTSHQRATATSIFKAFQHFGEPLQRSNSNITYQQVVPSQNFNWQAPPQNLNIQAPPQNQSRPPPNYSNKGNNVANPSHQRQDTECSRCKGKDTMLLNTQVQRTFIMPTTTMMPMIRSMLQKSMKLKLLMKSKYLNPGKRIIPSIKMKVMGRTLFIRQLPTIAVEEAEDWRQTNTFHSKEKC